jgi:hypothetical protein
VKLKCYKAEDREYRQEVTEDADKLREPEPPDGTCLQYVAKGQLWRRACHARGNLGGV